MPLRGFSLIELMVVLGIIAGLAAVSAGALVASQARLRLQQSATAIIEVSRRAQRLAQEQTPYDPATGTFNLVSCYGVYLKTTGGVTTATLVKGTAGAPATPVIGADGKTAMVRKLPSGVAVETANPTLAPERVSMTTLHWAFAYQTGLTLAAYDAGGGTMVWRNAAVGTSFRDGAQTINPTSWATQKIWDQTGVNIPIVAAGTSASPGLVVRDGTRMVAITVTTGGHTFSRTIGGS